MVNFQYKLDVSTILREIRKELEEPILDRNGVELPSYKVNNVVFEKLCEIHRYIINNEKDSDTTNEFMYIIAQILRRIFRPIVFAKGGYMEGWHLSTEEVERLIKSIYDLNIKSKVWLQDISSYYGITSKIYKEYNYPYGYNDILNAIHLIREHLETEVDPNRPQEPTNSKPSEWYRYKLCKALYDEHNVQTKFFQAIKYIHFNKLQDKGYSIRNLRITSMDQKRDPESGKYYNRVSLKPIDGKFVAEYPLFDKGKPVYFFPHNDKNELDSVEFNPKIGIASKIIKMDENHNKLVLKIDPQESMNLYKAKCLLTIVLRDDETTYLREKDAVNNFVDKYPDNDIKSLIIDKKVPYNFNDIKVEDYFNLDLNENQKKAVSNALNAKSLFCIHGPPGTGKTKVCSEIITQFLYFFPKSRILVTCASNEATDNILNSLKNVLTPELRPLIMRIGPEEITQDNPDSLAYKMNNNSIYNEEYVDIQKELVLTKNELEKRTKERDKLESKRKEMEEKLNKNKNELHHFVGGEFGSINRKEAGLLVKIEDLNRDMNLEKTRTKENQEKLRDLLDKQKFIENENRSLEEEISHYQELINENNEKLDNVNALRCHLYFKLDESSIKTRDSVVNSESLILFTTNSHAALIKTHFDLVILDEITQSTRPSSLIPICLTSKKVVIAGDNRQLPPTVFLKNKDYEEELNPNSERDRIKSFQTLSTSLFEDLYESIKDNPKICQFLNRQYRMNPLIIEFLNKNIYSKHNLESDESTKTHLARNGIFKSPLIFINCNGKERKSYISDEFSGSKVEFSNENEIDTVIKLVKKYAKYVPKSDIKVISPYLAQVRKINLELEPEGIIAKTVDSFQGQEAKIIILSLVRSNDNVNAKATSRIGFLVDERRFNVALTRFRNKLIVIGNTSTLSSHNKYYDEYEEKNKEIYYGALIDYIKEKGEYIDCLDNNYLNKDISKISMDDNTKKNELNSSLSKKLNVRLYRELTKTLSNEIVYIKKDENKLIETKIEEINAKTLEVYNKVEEKIISAEIKVKKTRYEEKTERFIKTGSRLLELMGPDLEFSGPTINFSKAYENELNVKLLSKFREFIRQDKSYDESLSEDRKDKDLEKLAKYVSRDEKKVEMGTFAYILKVYINSKVRISNSYLLKKFDEFVKTLPNPDFIKTKEGLLSALENITNGYRNGAGHTDEISKVQCEEFKGLILGPEGLLEKLITSVST